MKVSTEIHGSLPKRYRAFSVRQRSLTTRHVFRQVVQLTAHLYSGRPAFRRREMGRIVLRGGVLRGRESEMLSALESHGNCALCML